MTYPDHSTGSPASIVEHGPDGRDAHGGAVPLLGLTSTNTEEAGQNPTEPEDSNPPARLAPLLGTSTSQVPDISRGSSKNGPQKVSATPNCYGKMAHLQAETRGKPSVVRAVFATPETTFQVASSPQLPTVNRLWA